MPEPPPAVMAAATTDMPAAMTNNKSEARTVDSRQSRTAPDEKDRKTIEFTPGCGLAIFSTELGAHPKRVVDRQSPPPVIVRSGGVKDVVDVSRTWQARYKVQCLCIFPGQGWTVNDLWDAADLHLDTSTFCADMLNFISRDTYHAASRFADDWIQAYPERLAMVGSDKTLQHNAHDSFAIVDKIYNEGERAEFPRTFLWHVAHMMRSTILGVRPPTDVVAVASRLQLPAHVQHHDTAKVVNYGTSDPTKSASLHDVEATMTATRKSNRKITRSRSNKLIDPTANTSIEDTAPANSAKPPSKTLSSGPHHSQVRLPSQEWPLSANRHVEPVRNIPSSVSNFPLKSPTAPHQSLRVSKFPSRNMVATAYQQTHPHGWIENTNRTGSSHFPRQPSGGMSHLQSPRFMPANMSISQPMMAAGYVAPFAHGPPLMAANLASMQYNHPNVAPNGLVYHPTTMMPSPHSTHAYAHQPFAVRGVSMGDMTNNGYYANGMAHQNVDRTMMPRRGSNYNSNGTLYDPYNGTNSDFRGANGYGKGRKPSHSDNALHKDRIRNVSGSGVRPTNASYNTERVPSSSYNGGRYMGYSRLREHSEDDPSITEDRVAGCHEHWIGPDNTTVTELFVGDLPIDVHTGEVVKMFEMQTSISPASVAIRFPVKNDRPLQQPDRCHAFVA